MPERGAGLSASNCAGKRHESERKK